MLVGALRAADRRPTQFCAPSIFLRPCFRRPKANRRFTEQKQASPTELPRQVSCKPEQHSILLPFCLPAVQKSLSLLSIINFYPHTSCLRLSHPFFRNPAQIVGMAFFRNPVRIVGVVRFFGILFGQSFPQGGALLYYLYCSFIRIYLSAVVASAFRTRSNRRHAVFSESRLDRRCCPLFRNPVRTKLPAETFHPLRHRGPPCDKRTAAYPSNDVPVGNDLHAIYRIGQFPFA